MDPFLRLTDERFISPDDVPAVRRRRLDIDRARATIRRTYPIESRIVLGIERVVERLRRQPPAPGLALHITPGPSSVAGVKRASAAAAFRADRRCGPLLDA